MNAALLSDEAASHLDLSQLINRAKNPTHSHGNSRARLLSPGHILLWLQSGDKALDVQLVDGDDAVIQMVVELHSRYS